MAVLSKPIPPLYTVYVLRSTVRHASLYIGSTPNPPRRLKQHNGEAPGGAARTARNSLRPWQMVGLVTGFPSMIAALKFEWALNNPHISLHIPSSSRLTVSTSRKRNGHPRRPPLSQSSVISNLHLLLRVPSFARWPLKLHFFAPDVFTAWERWCNQSKETLGASRQVVTDFGPGAVTTASSAQAGADSTAEESWGIHSLPLDYAPVKGYVAKGRQLFDFEQQGDCVVCEEPMRPDDGLYALCPNDGCDGVGHLRCWSRHMLDKEPRSADEPIIPVQGSCPKCGSDIEWGHMMKELSLRVRGQKEVDKLLRTGRGRSSTQH
ncbi:uncharacterized protein E0L32_009294 [Thyridium curvatum]|uniref:GIY-YIG domain-containing protein n=1 Tax=Thyridium curvatum TaxID=1093900 RepID=A0A507AXA0_9PEZI|nr:uncharacterized protein E0L32_009294 [Thyridium curvatum]TPX09551.1 hypothetical protein E0L32_009294 [Thyridium curvatum]